MGLPTPFSERILATSQLKDVASDFKTVVLLAPLFPTNTVTLDGFLEVGAK